MSAPAAEASPRPVSPKYPNRSQNASQHGGWRATFSSLQTRNYRLFATGQLVSNTGSWVQRIAQDWLVLTLTGSATAVGITTALQCLPMALFGLTGGLIADRYPKRRILLCTQVGMASMATILAVLTLTHQVQVWHVYLIAFGLGMVVAVDNPTRQAFVTEMVGPAQLRNAISLNSSIFQIGRLIGPAISGVLLNLVGAGYSFAANAVSYIAPLIALTLIREADLHRALAMPRRRSGQLREGLRYVAGRPDVLWPTVLIAAFAFFTTNLPVTLAAYAKLVFHSGAGGYGLLNAVVAVGSVVGALVSARHGHTRLRGLAVVGGVLAILYVLAAAAPGQWAYCAVLLVVGAVTLVLYTTANSMVQLASDDGIRGRVMSVYLLVFTGSSALGGPLLGFVAERFGPSAGMLLAGLVPALVTVLVALRIARSNDLRLAVRPAGSAGRFLAVVPR